jgi:hypothetical protein
MRVLVAFDETYGVYGETIAEAIERSRPGVEAQAIDWEALEEVVHRQDPHLVICNPPVPENPISTREAWVELSLDTERPSRIRLGKQRGETLNPSLEELLSVVEEVEKRGE